MLQDERTKHPLLGEVRHTKKLFTKHIVCDVKVRNFTDVQSWQQRTKQFGQAVTSGLFLPESVEYVETKSEQVVRMKFCEAVYLLEDEKANRRKYQIPFREEELWFILFSLVECSKVMHSLGGWLGQVSPSTILLDQYGNVKVFSEQSVPHYAAIMQTVKKHNYCKAPEETNTRYSSTRAKSESFEIGITVLELALLDSCEEVFKIKPHVDQRLLSQCLGRARQHYSHFLYQTLMAMCQQDSVQRPSSGEIWAILYPYSKAITAVEPFRLSRELSTRSLQNYLASLKTASRPNSH